MPSLTSGRVLSLADLSTLVLSVAAEEQLWRPRLVIPRGGDRWWTRLSSDASVDVWLLSWLPGHSTDLHDHGNSSAAFAVVRGVLTELRPDGHGGATSYRRTPGSATWLAPGVIHDVHGAGVGPAVSIHAYSPPLEKMTIYDAAGRAVRTVHSSEPEREELPR